MKPEELKTRIPEKEFKYTASRSSGPGGQNINKVNTRVELRFSIRNTQCLTEEEKELLMSTLSTKINGEGELILSAQSERTQLMNKRTVTERFYTMVARALSVPVKRRPTSPTRESVRKRLEEKRSTGLRKKLRKSSDGPEND